MLTLQEKRLIEMISDACHAVIVSLCLPYNVFIGRTVIEILTIKMLLIISIFND